MLTRLNLQKIQRFNPSIFLATALLLMIIELDEDQLVWFHMNYTNADLKKTKNNSYDDKLATDNHTMNIAIDDNILDLEFWI